MSSTKTKSVKFQNESDHRPQSTRSEANSKPHSKRFVDLTFFKFLGGLEAGERRTTSNVSESSRPKSLSSRISSKFDLSFFKFLGGIVGDKADESISDVTLLSKLLKENNDGGIVIDKKKRAKGVVLKHKDLRCEICLFGATIVSFSTAGQELLFVSEKAEFDQSIPIRGGIPIVFPQFGAGAGTLKLPSHGFARTSVWKIANVSKDLNKALLTLSWKDPLSAKTWTHPFRLEYSIELLYVEGNKPSLKSSLRIFNEGLVGSEPFSFQALLHTYISVPGVDTVEISGLGNKFINQLENKQIQDSEQETLKIGSEVDWIYLGDGKKDQETVFVKGAVNGGTISITRSLTVSSKHVACDVVVWNPWIEKSKKMKDFGDEEYQNMICVEPGNVSRKDTIFGGEDAVLTQILTYSN